MAEISAPVMSESAPNNETQISSERRNEVTDRLQKRQEERQEELQRRRTEKDSSSATGENAKYFAENFAKEVSATENELSKCDSLSKNELVDQFDKISLSVQKIHKFVADSTMFLPSFEVRRAQETLNKLQTEFQAKRDKLIPKKKFTFSSKKRAGEKREAETRDSDKEKVDDVFQVGFTDCKFVDMHDQQLEKSSHEIYQKDVALAKLTGCTVKLFGAPSTVHMNNLKDCKVLCGPISTSVFIADCSNCVFVMACQQGRIHSTTDSQFYIHVTSRAIIEDCTGVRFAPYNWDYPDLDKHYDLAGLDRSKNHWNDIDDFNWLAADTPSPNWSLLDENERIKSWKI